MPDVIQETSLAKRNEEERALILGARDDPDNTKMPDGRTVTQARAETYEAHLQEARAAERMNTQRMREQSVANDPLYQQPETLAEVAVVPVTTPVETKRERPRQPFQAKESDQPEG